MVKITFFSFGKKKKKKKKITMYVYNIHFFKFDPCKIIILYRLLSVLHENVCNLIIQVTQMIFLQ